MIQPIYPDGEVAVALVKFLESKREKVQALANNIETDIRKGDAFRGEIRMINWIIKQITTEGPDNV